MEPTRASSFQTALDAAEALTDEQREDLIRTLRQRFAEDRREALARSIREARAERRRGAVRRGTVDELLRDLAR